MGFISKHEVVMKFKIADIDRKKAITQTTVNGLDVARVFSGHLRLKRSSGLYWPDSEIVVLMLKCTVSLSKKC